MSVDQGNQVRVLFNYSYEDDHGLVEIKEGEVYRLLEKTNNEWWHVCDKDKKEPLPEEDGIFVPARYVRELSDVDNALCTLDDVLQEEEVPVVYGSTPVRQKDAKCAPSKDPPGGRSTNTGTGRLPTDNSVNGMGKTAYDDEGDYVNLDQYRVDANIPKFNQQNTTSAAVDECDYANLPFHQDHHNLDGPFLSEGTYVRVLVEGLPWDVYEDHETKRKFFRNRETGELTWKPPRKDKPSSPVEKDSHSAVTDHVAKKPVSPSPVFALQPLPERDELYEKKEEGGDIYYVNKSTKEKWQQLVDEAGRPYYHLVGTNDTLWELPSHVPSHVRSKSETQEPAPRNGETFRQGGATASNTSTMSLMRQSKAKSMYGKIEMTPEEMSGPKAGTLPPNFSPSAGLEKSPSLPSFQLQPPVSTPYRFEDQLAGYLNKTKIAELGKKIKKNWSQAYVVLSSSNLVFYKDQKAADKKAGSPHGRPDGVISLLGARVDFNPPKDITGSSRRNTILLYVSSGNQFLLHSEDEKKIHEWLFRLKVVANDLSQQPPQRDPDSSSSSGKSVAASVGVGRSLSATSDDINPSDRSNNWTGIRTRLKNFIVRRPTQEDLVKRGIIKDAVFGSALQDLCDRDKSPVPSFILECITAVEAKGLEHDGLYRISGNMAEIQRLRYVVDKDEGHNLLEDQWDIHTLTGALKLFFRELREPLFTNKHFGKFIDAIKKESRKDKLKAFKDALSALPKCNYETMRVLFQHLKNLIQFSQENRMQTQNVAIVFGPTLMWAEGDFANMAVNTLYQSKVVEFLLLEYETLFR